MDYDAETDEDDETVNRNRSNDIDRNEASPPDNEVIETIPGEGEGEGEKPTNGNIAIIETHGTDEQIGTNEINAQPTEPSNTPSLIRTEIPAVATCDVDNGGCEQTCNMVQNELTGAMMIECSCGSGYYLDLAEGKHCLGE